MAARTICGALDKAAHRNPSHIAILSPFQPLNELTYDAFRKKTNALASWLSLYGYEKGDLLISDLPNVTENLVLQIACNRIGVGYGTAKAIEVMTKFPKVKGSVSATGEGFLAETNLPLPCISGEFLADLIKDSGLDEVALEEVDEGDEDTPHGFYNTTVSYTNRQALRHGMEAERELSMTQDDVVCVAITLSHPFGMGSAVCSAIGAGAKIVLPSVGGIQGCGVPSERAASTLDVLRAQKCSILFADTHTFKALPPLPLSGEGEGERLHLRGGVIKIGSGSTFLDETREYAGIKLRTIGKKD